MRCTTIYEKNNNRREKLCSMREYVEMGRLSPGQKLLIGEVGSEGESYNTETIWVGNATPFHRPSTSDAEIGWPYDDELMKLYVLEVEVF